MWNPPLEGEWPFRGCIAWYGTEAFHMDAYILVPYCITPTLEEAVSHSFRGSIYLTFPLILAVVDGYAACLSVLNIGCWWKSATFDISLIFFGIVQIAPIDWIIKNNQRWLKIFVCRTLVHFPCVKLLDAIRTPLISSLSCSLNFLMEICSPSIVGIVDLLRWQTQPKSSCIFQIEDWSFSTACVISFVKFSGWNVKLIFSPKWS